MNEKNPLLMVSDAVFTMNSQWEITSFNNNAEALTGLAAGEVIGKQCGEVFLCESLSPLCGLGAQLAEGRTVVDLLLASPETAADRQAHIRVTAIPIPDAAGSITGAVVALRPATHSDLIYPLLFDSITDGVFSIDRDMRITSFNRAAERISGWTSEEVLGRRCDEIFKSNICGKNCILEKCLQTGTSHAQQAIFITGRHGESIPISIVADPLVDIAGNVIGGVEVFHDITSVIQHDLILESVADGVFTVDRNWKITSFNRAAEKITGWSRKDAIGRSCGDVFHSSICGENCAIAKSLYSGQPVSNLSIFIKSAAGKQIPISISASPLLDSAGNVIGGVETFRDLSVVNELRKQLSRRYTFGEIVSKSASMQRIFAILPEVAESDSNVLILGESGTGKELIARAIHNAGRRGKGPFVAVNCGALPDTLLESELFGYKAGAFTDAKQDRKGRFAAAEGGTLFLDEIGDIPSPLQVKLLRVLQERVYEPLGSNKPVKADVRIIAATNRDLHILVQEAIFREDLYYRLNVVKINLPPLKERKKDIPMLIEHFVKQFSAQQGKDIVGISDAALSILMRYDFPGNIRELENIIEYAFILCHGGFIQPEHLPEPFAPQGKASEPRAPAMKNSYTLEELEKQAIHHALERNQWRRLATCRELGISKDTLRRKIKRYKLESPYDEIAE